MNSSNSPHREAATKAANSRSRTTNPSQILVILIVSIFLLVIAVLFVVTSGAISGSELNPYTFQKRRFSYTRIPYTQMRVTRTELSHAAVLCSNDILQHLTAATANPRWDVADVTQGQFKEVRGPHLLVELLSADDPMGRRYWEKWSSDQPELAKILWPIVQEAAIANQYERIPALLSIAEKADDPSRLEFDAKQLLQNPSWRPISPAP